LKFKITKNYHGNVEFIYGEESTILTDNNPTITLTEKQYETIPEHKKYLIDNMFVIVEFVEEKVYEVKDQKKFNKK
jgi:hypothetical protein